MDSYILTSPKIWICLAFLRQIKKSGKMFNMHFIKPVHSCTYDFIAKKVHMIYAWKLYQP
jgi:hypothetical protein